MGFKQINRVFIIIVIVPLLIIKLASAKEDEQTHELLKARLSLDYTKKTAGNKMLKARLTSRVDGKWTGVGDAEVYFYAQIDTTHTLLGKTLTNNNGEAIMQISAGRILKSSDGEFDFNARFEGNQTYDGVEKELIIRDIQLIISFYEVDSVKKVHAEAYEITGSDDKLPLEDIDIYFYVTRLFGLLKVGEGWLINGKSSVEFPNDLPGDKEGNLTIVGRIEDNEVYGNVEVRGSINWGTDIPDNPVKAARELWTRTAPLWMIIALVLLLSFTWIIYITLFYNMFRIRKAGITANNIDNN